MKTITKLFVILFLLSITSFAQVKLTANAGGQLPTGDFKNGYDAGLGVMGGIEYQLNNSNVALTGEFGYNKFTTVINLFGLTPDMTILTFMGGVKYFIKSPGSTIYPYLGGNLGYMNSKIDIAGTTSESSFIFAPMGGVRFELGGGGTAIDVNVRYNSSSKNGTTISFMGANAGFSFAL